MQMVQWMLTYWDLYKTAAILQAPLSNAFSLKKFMHFDSNFTYICSQGPTDDKSVLIQVMAWYWTGNKSLPKSMMTYFIEALWRY